MNQGKNVSSVAHPPKIECKVRQGEQKHICIWNQALLSLVRWDNGCAAMVLKVSCHIWWSMGAYVESGGTWEALLQCVEAQKL